MLLNWVQITIALLLVKFILDYKFGWRFGWGNYPYVFETLKRFWLRLALICKLFIDELFPKANSLRVRSIPIPLTFLTNEESSSDDEENETELFFDPFTPGLQSCEFILDPPKEEIPSPVYISNARSRRYRGQPLDQYHANQNVAAAAAVPIPLVNRLRPAVRLPRHFVNVILDGQQNHQGPPQPHAHPPA